MRPMISTQKNPVNAGLPQTAMASESRSVSPSTVKLKASGMNFFYGAFQALHGINLQVETNRITSLIGPSGCGKSTFLRTLNRINDTLNTARWEGEGELDDHYIRDIDVTSLRRRVGMVFQRPNPFPKSIFDNIAYGPKVNGFKGNLSDIVEKSLRRAALWDEVKDKLQKSAYALSGRPTASGCRIRTCAGGESGSAVAG